jgi:hypothetical protein
MEGLLRGLTDVNLYCARSSRLKMYAFSYISQLAGSKPHLEPICVILSIER